MKIKTFTNWRHISSDWTGQFKTLAIMHYTVSVSSVVHTICKTMMVSHQTFQSGPNRFFHFLTRFWHDPDISSFRLGCPNFTFPNFDPTPVGGTSCSLFFPDQAIYQGHPRFRYAIPHFENNIVGHCSFLNRRQLGPWYNKGPRDWQNNFACYNEVLLYQGSFAYSLPYIILPNRGSHSLDWKAFAMIKK